MIDQKRLEEWIESRCTVNVKAYDLISHLFADWVEFAESVGCSPGSSNRFSRALEKTGFQRVINPPGHKPGRGFYRIKVAEKAL